MNSLLGRRALVVGAGIGGLSMAGALAKYFEQVEILERDRPPVSAASRPGAPQDRHPHGLLAGGLQAVGEIFPGFENDLAGAGAVPIKVARTCNTRTRMSALYPIGISAYRCSVRPGR